MKKTILLVDDSESIREAVSFTLEQAGFHTLKAEDGNLALPYLDGRDIHLVLSDLHMPQMNGIALTKEIRAKDAYKHIPILILTTETSDTFKNEAKKAGATGWLVKQSDRHKILKTIKKLIR